MNGNIKASFYFILVASVILLVSCRPHQPSRPSGTVSFDRAGVSLVPGPEWDQVYFGVFTEGSSICEPALKGLGVNDGSLIQVFKTRSDAGVGRATDILKRNIKSNPNTIKRTMKLEEFNSINGAHGVHVSYNYSAKNLQGEKTLTAHVFLFQNAEKNCIAINYITSTNRVSPRVLYMIIDTLKLN